MPKPTFLKLQKAKQDRFLAVALEEFAKNDYDHASITRIVKVLDIAKGSVYQYFENKKDLYFYLIDAATQRRLEYIKPLMRNPPSNVFEIISQLFQRTLHFDIENPLYSRLLANAANEKFSEDLGNAMIETRKRSMDFMRGLLEREVLMGGIRFDINVEFISYLMAQINTSVLDFLIIQHKIDGETLLNSKKLKKQIAEEDIVSISRQVADFLKVGLKN